MYPESGEQLPYESETGQTCSIIPSVGKGEMPVHVTFLVRLKAIFWSFETGKRP